MFSFECHCCGTEYGSAFASGVFFLHSLPIITLICFLFVGVIRETSGLGVSCARCQHAVVQMNHVLLIKWFIFPMFDVCHERWNHYKKSGRFDCTDDDDDDDDGLLGHHITNILAEFGSFESVRF